MTYSSSVIAKMGMDMSRINGKKLKSKWGVNVVHALYNKDGNWYEYLKSFPGALFDPTGYIAFETENEYLTCTYLQFGDTVHVPATISAIPGYVMVEGLASIASDLEVEEPVQPPRAFYKVNRVIRDTLQAKKVKTLHHYRCQICKDRLTLFDSQNYAEAHHLQPLGIKHLGPDSISNIICVCPNCHAKLDFGAIEINSKALNSVAEHNVDSKFIDYHNKYIFRGSKECK